jgi:hypothetical protein
MQYVQSLPPVYTPEATNDTVAAAEAVPAVRPVTPQNPTTIPRQRLDTRLPALEQSWAPRPTAVEGERRKVCRRLQHDAVLNELRSGVDRRRRNQRRNDLTTAVDEKI